MNESTGQIHELVQRVTSNAGENSIVQIFAGLKLPFSSFRFLLKNRSLWPFVVVPALINLVLFVLVGVGMVLFVGKLFAGFWEQPAFEAWYDIFLIVVWYFLRVLLIPLSLVLAYFLVMMLGGVVASPFNDKLSEKTELLLIGRERVKEHGVDNFVYKRLKSIVTSLVYLVSYLLLMAPILALNLIPGVGSIAATIFGALVSAMFVYLEYSDVITEERKYTYGARFGLFWRHRFQAGGFGLGTSLLLWIPFLNFLCMPVAVIGGTIMGLGLHAAGHQPADES